MNKINRLIGILGIVTFVATGVWMRVTFGPIDEGVTLERMMYRSAHIYILFGSMLNLFAATQQQGSRSARVGSVLIALTPPVFLAAFLIEPKYTIPGRPICLVGVALALVGTIVHHLAARRQHQTAG